APDRRRSGPARTLSRIKVALGVAISVVLLVYLFRGVDLAELGRHLREARWGWVAVATAIAPLQIWVRGRRGWYLFPPGSNPPPLTPAMMIGYMANNVLPLRAGEVVRIYVVARRWAAAGATVVGERVLERLVVVLILAILVLMVPVPQFLEMAALIVLAIDLVGIAVLIALPAAPDACVRVVA